MIDRFSQCPVVPVFIKVHPSTKKVSILDTEDLDITQFTCTDLKRGRKKVGSTEVKCPCCEKKFDDKINLIKHWLNLITEPKKSKDEICDENSTVEKPQTQEAVVAVEGSSSGAKAENEAETGLVKVEGYNDLYSSHEDLADWGLDDDVEYFPEPVKKKIKKIKKDPKEPKESKELKELKESKESKALVPASKRSKALVPFSKKEGVYECDRCKKKFQAKGAVKKHMMKLCYIDCYGGPKFTCELCDQKFVRKNDRKKHVKTVHYMAPTFTCDFCQESFGKKLELKRHIKTHPKPWKCTFCSAAFKRKQHLINHSVKHSDVRPFICDVCGATFKLKQNLADHKKTHGNNRIYMCHVCSGTFKTVTTLYHHMKTHSDYKPFPCELCSFRFKKRHDLKKHMLTHSNVKPFVCDLCGYASKRVSDLNSHKKTVHSIFFNDSRNNPHNNVHSSVFTVGTHNAITAGPSAPGNVLVVANNGAVTITNSSALVEMHHNALNEAHNSNPMNLDGHSNTLNNGQSSAHASEHSNEPTNAQNNVHGHIIFSNTYNCSFVGPKMISL